MASLHRLTFLLPLARQALVANIIPIIVGKDGLAFTPNLIRAFSRDVIEFRFLSRNHSVIAGDFEHACRLAHRRGFFSGFPPHAPRNSQRELLTFVNLTTVGHDMTCY